MSDDFRRSMDLASESLSNARDLTEEALLLLGNERFARAYFLATIALEEVGKHVMWASSSLLSSFYSGHVSKTQKRSREHVEKLIGSHMLLADMFADEGSGPKIYDTIENGARGNHKLKLQALYVDLRGGAVMTPAQMISQELAMEKILEANAVVQLADNVWRGGAEELVERIVAEFRSIARDNGFTLDESFDRDEWYSVILEWASRHAPPNPRNDTSAP